MNFLIVSLALVAAVSAGGNYPYGGSTVYQAVAPSVYPPSYVPPLAVYAKPMHIGGTEYRTQDTLGQYSYGFNSDNGIQKTEVRGVDGSVSGSYGYMSPEGQRVDITYTAGEEGFVASGDALPKQVAPTPEVAEATRNHEMAIKEMEAKIAAAPKPMETMPLAYAHVPYAHVPYAHVPYAYAHPVAYAYKPKPFATYSKPLTNYGYSYSFIQ